MGFVKTEFGARDRGFVRRGEMVVVVKDAITLHAAFMDSWMICLLGIICVGVKRVTKMH